MSNRSLVEINHDAAGVIKADPIDFAQAMLDYLRSGASVDARLLEAYGVRVFGMRHHSNAFAIDWGGIKAGEEASPKW